ncbi:MAG: PD-(D/E)XK nuclease family protein [bacterium]
MKLSYSSLTSFEQCPAKYKYQQIDRIPVVTPDALWYGSLLHSILEEIVKEYPRLSIQYALARLQRNWDNSRFGNLEENFEKFKEAQKIIADFFKDHFLHATENLVSIEEYFKIPYKQKHKIVGKIDRINKTREGQIIITDYKTSKRLPTPRDLDYDIQLSFYFWAAQHLFPENKGVVLILHFLKFNKTLKTSRNQKHVDYLHKRIDSFIEDVQKSDFAPKKNRLCDWCEYKHICPMYSKKPKLFTI